MRMRRRSSTRVAMSSSSVGGAVGMAAGAAAGFAAGLGWAMTAGAAGRSSSDASRTESDLEVRNSVDIANDPLCAASL